jgi:cytochrome c oxidase cbb3-type subunit 3
MTESGTAPTTAPIREADAHVEADADTGHEYDGIREFDNRLPNWWLATLFISIVFAYGYYFYYHVLDGGGLWAGYRSEQAARDEAEARKPVDEGQILALAKDPAAMGKAQALFVQQCAACHKPDGSGQIGPNLTDRFWLHGNKPADLYGTIYKGVASKGMPAWGPLLGAEKVRFMAAYVTTFSGKNLAGKAPEGVEIK